MTANEHILQTQLQEYCESGLYPMHMPGHKRAAAPAPGLPCEWDVTEVPGTDDLHHAEGILREAMDRTASLFGSRRTWYLVNGSTCGILAAVYACVPAGGEIIAARNCHKSVFHAMELLNLQVHWLMPSFLEDWEICGEISPADTAQMLREYPAAKTVILTSPTYEGVLSDVAGIAAVCHAAGARLIVDEAHGAHLGLFREEESGFGREAGETESGRPGEETAPNSAAEDAFPDSALHLGADLVIQSAHKTLPSLTQTALLHLARPEYNLTPQKSFDAAEGAREDRKRQESGAVTPASEESGSRECAAEEAALRRLEDAVEHALDIFETSSPSYPLMASLDGCTGILARRGRELFREWRHQIRKTRDVIGRLPHVRALCGGRYDDSRFLLRPAEGSAVTGKMMSEYLRQEGLESEMHCGRNVLLMTSCCDTVSGWDCFRKALARLDARLASEAADVFPDADRSSGRIFSPEVPRLAMSPAKAHRAVICGQTQSCLLREAEGSVCAEYIMAYPPGIPILIPGEYISAQTIRLIRTLTLQGSNMVRSASEYRGSRAPGQCTDPEEITVLIFAAVPNGP